MGAALIAAALAGSDVAMPVSPAVVQLNGSAIHAGDILPRLRGAAARVEIARLPTGRSSVTLSTHAVQALVRRALPGASFSLPNSGHITFRRAATTSASRSCFVARDAISAGEAIDRDMVRPAICRAGTAAAPVRYDAVAGTSFATAQIEAGAPVGGALPTRAPVVAPADRLTLVARSGPVTVQRTVSALQWGRRGGRLFVRTPDGQILAAPVAWERQ